MRLIAINLHADKERAYRLVPYDQFHLAWLQENGKRGLALDPQQDALVRQLQNEVRDMQKDVSLAMTSEADLRFEFSKYDVNGDGWLNTTEACFGGSGHVGLFEHASW